MKLSLFDYLLGHFFERQATSDARDVRAGALRFSTKVRGSRHVTAIDIPPMEGPVKKDFSAEEEALKDEAEPGVRCEKCVYVDTALCLLSATYLAVYSGTASLASCTTAVVIGSLLIFDTMI